MRRGARQCPGAVAPNEGRSSGNGGRTGGRIISSDLDQMRLLVTIFLGLPFAAAAAQGPGAEGAATSAASHAARHHETIWTAYHAASGYGDVELRPMLLVASPELRLTAMFVFKGERLTAPPPWVSVAFVATGSKARFTTAHAVRFLPGGGTPLNVAPKGVVHVVRPLGDGRVEERIAFRLTARDFLRLVGAPTLIARVGATEIALGAEQREALRDFASRMRPSVFDSTRAAATARVAVRGYAVRKDVYERRDVDEPALPSTLVPRPPYPAEIPAAERVARQVLLEFIVDSSGVVDLASLRSQSPERDAPFVAALRVSFAEYRFTPAMKGGRPVAQIVRQAILFEP